VTRDFVESVALTGAVDAGNDTEGAAPAYLITAHAAKGREFDNVYVVGVEDGIYPHARSEDEGAHQEERRLLFVAASRARHLLTLSWCARRNRFGHYEDTDPSPFLAGLAGHVVEITAQPAVRGEWRSTPSPRREARGAISGPKIHLTAVASQRAAPQTVAAGAFEVGTLVRHGTFGDGLVTARSGDNAVIKFASGVKTLALGFARLEVLEP
jgi:DNA helicase-2/ATP-dependent DNA helicase PcrA